MRNGCNCALKISTSVIGYQAYNSAHKHPVERTRKSSTWPTISALAAAYGRSQASPSAIAVLLLSIACSFGGQAAVIQPKNPALFRRNPDFA
jgi:hypothetical protein